MNAIVAKIGLPVVVKPSRGGSALGVTLVRSLAELPHAMVTCFAYGDVALLERAITGIELATSVIETADGCQALPSVEIVTDGPYDYDARYNPGRTEYFAPARLSAQQAEAVAQTAITAHKALGLRHLSRTDLILTPDGSIQFLEVNVAPGMTETSLFPQAALAGGRALPELYRSIVETARTRRIDPPADRSPANDEAAITETSSTH